MPLANTEVYVLDEFLQLVPKGSTGELWIGGVGVSRGYVNRPEMTQQRFVQNPFGIGRIYKTGDLARWLSDGQLAHLGRIDHQVKIRGHRIELSEIEAVLNLHSDVGESAVVVRKDRPGDEQLVAYVTVASPSPTLVNELRNLLEKNLPTWMIPSSLMVLNAFPRTANGKLDRNGLPAPEGSVRTAIDGRSLASFHSAAPRTSIEEKLAGIWCEILALRQVGANENFFELGGHSLSAMRVVARVSTSFKVDLSLRTFFENPTISSLANQIEYLRLTMNRHKAELIHQDRTAAGQQLSLQNQSVTPSLSFGQEQLWFLHQLEAKDASYNIPMALRLEGELDAKALRDSLDEVVRRHETLRTRFESVGGQPRQVIASASSVEVPFVDLSAQPERDREAEVSRLCREHAERPFDLDRDVLLRARLFRLEAKQHVLFLNLHHIAADGWSISVLLRELGELYAAFCNERPSPLPALAVQYSDFAVWQRDWMQSPELQKQLDYWKERLAAAPALLKLPTDRPRPPVQNRQGDAETAVVPELLLKELRALSNKAGASLFMTLMAAFQVLLSRYSGEEDITIGFPVAGRDQIKFEGSIGLFVNTLVLRGDLAGNPKFSEFLRQIRRKAFEAYAHGQIPFGKVVAELQPKRSLSYAPLFQVLFALQNTPTIPKSFGQLDLKLNYISSTTSKFDLSILLSEEPEGLTTKLEYSTDLFNSDTILRLLSNFRILLESIVADPNSPIRQLSLLGPAERQQLLVDWNNTGTPYPKKTVSELFELQASLRPNAVAIVFNEIELTYHQLNEKANQLAHHLSRLGVKPDSLVCFCLERSPQLIVTLLGILKSGAAYVALDTSAPSIRLKSIVEDVQPTAIIVGSRRQKSFFESLPCDTQLICLEQDADVIGNEHDGNRISTAGSESLAYVCFTSGSTGRPKGVSIPHRGIVRLVNNTSYVSISTSDVFLQLAPVSFDAATFEIWGCLLNGARLVVAPPGPLSLHELASLIRKYEVSVLWLTAGLFNLMVDHELESLDGVRQLLTGGDVLSPAHARKALEALGEGRLINGYGPTENTTFTCCYLIGASDTVGNSIPIGRPISNTQCFILDDSLQPVPIGVRGELYIGGDGLARGYLNDPDLTAKKFIPNPFAPNALLYRTGDFARYLPDGNIEFLGRIDYQVKIRGFRVELAEIETVLKEHPAVRDCIALVLGDEIKGKTLTVYIIAAGVCNVGELQKFLSERLLPEMIPSSFVFLEAFPLTSTGKVDRSCLPAPTPNLTSF